MAASGWTSPPDHQFCTSIRWKLKTKVITAAGWIIAWTGLSSFWYILTCPVSLFIFTFFSSPLSLSFSFLSKVPIVFHCIVTHSLLKRLDKRVSLSQTGDWAVHFFLFALSRTQVPCWKFSVSLIYEQLVRFVWHYTIYNSASNKWVGE